MPFTQSSLSHYRLPLLCPPSSYPKPRVPSKASKNEPVIFSKLTLPSIGQP
jgi:hypothetical protein